MKHSAERGRMKTYCAIRSGITAPLQPGMGGERSRALLVNRLKWANGTTLTYAFFQAPGALLLQKQVETAIKRWADLGIGIGFRQVARTQDAQVRVGFQPGDGHWSYLGREILSQGIDDRTLNLDPSDGIESGDYGLDVATHELGHTLGLPHEHQNPRAGIVWDEPAVYAALAQAPNNWSHETTFRNIIEKIAPDAVQGSAWDKDSIMHYPFPAGLITTPDIYRTHPLQPAGGLSARDKQWILSFYPAKNKQETDVLAPFTSQRLELGPGEQRDFLLTPTSTRTYQVGTFGTSDTIALLYEKSASAEVFLGGDDDSGLDRNALLSVRLVAGRTYLLKIRLYYAASRGETSVMWW